MDNELGIIGYEKKEICKQNNNSILINIFGIYLFLSIMTILVFYTIKFNMILIAIALIIVLIFCVILALCEIKYNKNEKIKRLYIYFENLNYKQNFYWDASCTFKKTIDFILKNNIKPIENKDYYAIHFTINEKSIPFYNKLKDQYKLVDY